MTDVEAATGRLPRSAAIPHPRVAGRRVADVTAAVGGVLWLGLVAGTVSGAVPVPVPALYVCLAALVLVPLGLGLVAVPREVAIATTAYRAAVFGQLPAALALAIALATPRGSIGGIALTFPWLGVTGAIALCGVGRLASRSGGPIPELAIDAGLLYVPVAATFLVLHAAGISLRFAPILVLLTGVHFHYAGFALPLVVGLTGRRLTDGDGRFPATITGRVTAVVTPVVVGGIGLIAVGITFSPLLEVVAVAAFTAGVVGFATCTLRGVVPAVPRLPGLLFAVAALSLCWTMALAFAFAFGSLSGTPPLVSIPEMIRWHGSVNAFGFALPSLVAFRLLEA